MPRIPQLAARTIAFSIIVLVAAGLLSAAHARAEGTGTSSSTTGDGARGVAAVVPIPVITVGATAPVPVDPVPTSAIAPTTTAPAPATGVTPAPAPPPTPTVPPHAAPPATAAPTTAPAPTAAPATAGAQQEPTEARIQRAFREGVPDAWRAAIPVRFEVIEGSVSWAHSDGLIQLGTSHIDGRHERLVDVIAHEFGHLIAFRYGSQEYAGAGPAGWPAPSRHPEEAWADCTQQAVTGRVSPSHGLPACEADALAWVADWLAPGPDAHVRTR